MRNQRFGDDGRALVRSAHDRARALGHPGLGCEHLLYAVAYSSAPVGVVAREYGLMPGDVAAQTERLLAGSRRVFDGLDADALATIGIDLRAVREAVEANFGTGPARWAPRHRRVRLPGHRAVTGRARSCLAEAEREANRSGASVVAAHHIGAAVVAADGGLVPPILSALGVSAPLLRAAILDRAH